MSEEIDGLTVKADLILSDEILETVERKFHFLEEEEEETEDETESKTLDEVIAEYLREIESRAKDKQLEIIDRDEFYTKSVMSLILFFIKPDDCSTTLKVPVQSMKEETGEEEEDGESTETE